MELETPTNPTDLMIYGSYFSPTGFSAVCHKTKNRIFRDHRGNRFPPGTIGL